MNNKSNINKLMVIGLIILIILIILISLLITAVLFSIPVILSYLIGMISSFDDSYLLMELSFCICCVIGIFLVPIIIFLFVYRKKNKLKALTNFLKKYKIISSIIIILILIFETIFIARGYICFNDIKDGSQEVVMTDAIVKVKYYYKSRNSYIIGNIDDKEIQLKLTRDARSQVEKNKQYDVLKIKYYKHMKEVYDIKVYE